MNNISPDDTLGSVNLQENNEKKWGDLYTPHFFKPHSKGLIQEVTPYIRESLSIYNLLFCSSAPLLPTAF